VSALSEEGYRRHMTRRIQIQIFPDGRIQAETQGIKGKKCIEYIGVLEEILGAEAVDSEYTSEYYISTDTVIEATQEQDLREEH
jgi:hypothetical protein